MADNGNGGSNVMAFLAGVLVVGLIGFAVYTYSGMGRPQQTAQLELNVPDVNINPPDVHMPSPPPAPSLPPAANSNAN